MCKTVAQPIELIPLNKYLHIYVLSCYVSSVNFYFFFYCSCNQERNFSSEIDSITIGIELCNIPHISEHCPKNEPSLLTSTDTWLSLPG